MKHHHSFDPAVAKQLGVNAALIIWNLSYLQSQREAQGGPDEFYHEGKWWVRHSYESLAEWHDYLSVPQIKRIMKKLEDDGHVLKSSLGNNPWDRTTYWHVSSMFMHSTESHYGSDGIVLSDSTKSYDVHSTKSYDVQHKNNKEQHKRGASRFTPPTLDQVHAYVKEKNYRGVNCELFMANYETTGWMVGKNKMKCWKSAVSKWNMRQKQFSGNDNVSSDGTRRRHR